MPWVKFTGDFGWRDPRMMQRHELFLAGEERMVTTPCAEAAIAAGKAKRFDKLIREEKKRGD